MKILAFSIECMWNSIDPTSLLICSCWSTPHYIPLTLNCSTPQLLHSQSSYKCQTISTQFFYPPCSSTSPSVVCACLSDAYVEWTVSCITPHYNSLLAIPLKLIAKVVCYCILADHLRKNFCRLKDRSLPLINFFHMLSL